MAETPNSKITLNPGADEPPRIVIKIGTNLLTRDDNTLNVEFIDDVARQIVNIKEKGYDVILVSSGATTAGRSKIQTGKETKNIPFKQALAAVGQSLLIHTYKKAFFKFDITVAQALLTNQDFKSRYHYINIRNTLELLIRLNVLPIINENDVTSVKEFAIGENDMLSAQLASMLSADLLVILTTVKGLYTGIPGKDPDAKFIPVVEKVDQAVHEFASGAGSKFSTGGMITKLKAAEFATQSGVPVVIANGANENILEKIILRESVEGTYFPTNVSKLESRKNWLRHMVKADAYITVDDGAVRALTKGKKSLLPSGIIEVSGNFVRGDIIHIQDQKGHKVALGQINYGAQNLNKIKGHHSSEIPMLLVKPFEDEVIQRDHMVIL